MLPPLLDQNLRVASVFEPMHRQALIAKLPVEALVRSVLPGLARLDQHVLHSALSCPLQQCRAHELRAIVASQDLRIPALLDYLFENLNHPFTPDRARHIDRKTLFRKFNNQRQTFQLLSVAAAVEHKVICPNLIGRSRCKRLRAVSRYLFLGFFAGT